MISFNNNYRRITMNIFSCNLEIRSSHDVNYIEFSGKSSFILDEEFNFPCPYGNKETKIGINNTDEGIIKITVSSKEIGSKEDQCRYLDKIAILLSSILGFKEKNPYYGTPFITLDLHTFNSKREGSALESTIQISDSFSIESTTHVKFSDYDFTSIQDTELLSHYYNGLKAEGDKSKYFHFFLILEILEGCDLYKRTFPDGTLFSEEEKVGIREFSNNFSGAKKSTLLNCLSRTEKFRNEKLLYLIQQLGITELNSVVGQRQLEQSIIKDITDARNKLFHKSENFEQGLLYYVLFPLVTQVIEHILNNPRCVS